MAVPIWLILHCNTPVPGPPVVVLAGAKQWQSPQGLPLELEVLPLTAEEIAVEEQRQDAIDERLATEAEEQKTRLLEGKGGLVITAGLPTASDGTIGPFAAPFVLAAVPLAQHNGRAHWKNSSGAHLFYCPGRWILSTSFPLGVSEAVSYTHLTLPTKA